MAKPKNKEEKEIKKVIEKEKVSALDKGLNFLNWLGLSWIISIFLFFSFCTIFYFIHLSVIEDPTFIFNKNSLVMKSEIPHWVEENGLTTKIRLNTKEVSKSYSGKSFFDEEALGVLHTALMGTNWVKDVKLEKSFPSKINMTVNFRKPVVAFLYNDFWYTLDNEGISMPVVENKGTEKLNVIRFIDTPQSINSLKAGEKIGVDSIKSSLSLSILISERVTIPGNLLKVIFIKDIEEKNYRFKLFFQNGLEVLWGTYLVDEEVDRFPGKYLTSEEKFSILFGSLGKSPNQLHINVEFSK